MISTFLLILNTVDHTKMYSQDVKKFLRRVEVKAFFHNKEDDVNKPNKDTSKTLQIRKPSWTSLEGQFAYFFTFYQGVSSEHVQT